MLRLEQIKQYYPENLRSFEKSILREYLQYKILEIIFNSEYATKLSFLGGTALRIIYDNSRFSEDLDFDNLGLSDSDFNSLTEIIQSELIKQGYEIEFRNVFKAAYRCYIKFPKILFDNKLSNLRDEKIMIQFDTMPHNFSYELDRKILNKFDVFTQIFVTPIDILLSQKIYALFDRKRVKGRDVFDIVFLLGQTKPNYKYLKTKMNIDNPEVLKEKLIDFINSLDSRELAREVEPFLFNSKDKKKIEMFEDFIKQTNF
jgi:predicted nucleotidyltransferase component of viral defense system